MTGMVIGIDLGTTNSAVSIWKAGQAELIPNREGKWLTPSVVGLDDDGNIIIGESARRRLHSHPHLTKGSFKRYMGTDTRLILGMSCYRAEELSALLLRRLKEDASIILGCPVTDAVITVPAYFNDVQRRAVKSAGELAGLKVLRLLNEPTAASMAFGLMNNRAQKYLTFDLGGGTFDVSVVDMFEGVVEVRACSGDILLGGDDFNEIICQWMLGQYPSLDEDQDILWPLLLTRAEDMKCALSSHNEATTQLEWKGEIWTWTLSEAQFSDCCQPLLKRLQHPILQALNDARLTAEELDHVLLVGGATRMPLIRQTVARLFGHFPRHELNPEEAVARGAGMQAGMMMADTAIEDIVLTDVMPFSLGIEVSKANRDKQQNGFFLPLIERNTWLPVSKMQWVTTSSDYQSVVEINIYQGEARRVEDNIFLGKMLVNIPRRPAGEVSLEIRFTYTLDGLLEVECRHDLSQLLSRLVIEKVPGQMSEEQIDSSFKKLNDLKVHPCDKPENRALLARCAAAFAFLLGEERAHVDYLASVWENALDTQDPRQIAVARQQVEKALDILEGANKW
jgi:molecular chaperone HscC